MQYILKCKNVVSSTYVMDLQWQQFYIHDGIYSHNTTIQDICNSKNKNETNTNITFTSEHDRF
jgi:hypothetical protein